MGCGCGKGKPHSIRSATFIPKATTNAITRQAASPAASIGKCRRCGAPTMKIILHQRDRAQCTACKLIQ